MKGVYVIDINDNDAFICHAQDYAHALTRFDHWMQTYIAHMHSPIQLTVPYAYHYYPMLPNETDMDAEVRLIQRVRREQPTLRILTPWVTLQELAKGTWSPNHRTLSRMVAHASNSTVSDLEGNDPDLFPISLSA